MQDYHPSLNFFFFCSFLKFSYTRFQDQFDIEEKNKIFATITQYSIFNSRFLPIHINMLDSLKWNRDIYEIVGNELLF